jgi:hypothetical protein
MAHINRALFRARDANDDPSRRATTRATASGRIHLLVEQPRILEKLPQLPRLEEMIGRCRSTSWRCSL